MFDSCLNLKSINNFMDILQEYDVQEVILALPTSVSVETRKVLYERYKQAGFKIKSYDYPASNIGMNQ